VIREGSTESEVEEGSWCDCVAGAVPMSKKLELMRAVGFVECEHVGFPNYRLSDHIIAATFCARKPVGIE